MSAWPGWIEDGAVWGVDVARQQEDGTTKADRSRIRFDVLAAAGCRFSWTNFHPANAWRYVQLAAARSARIHAGAYVWVDGDRATVLGSLDAARRARQSGDLPIAFDIETPGLDGAWIRALVASEPGCVLYGPRYVLEAYGLHTHPRLWHAEYPAHPQLRPSLAAVPPLVWQFGGSTAVPGVQGDCDLNVCFRPDELNLSEEDIMASKAELEQLLEQHLTDVRTDFRTALASVAGEVATVAGDVAGVQDAVAAIGHGIYVQTRTTGAPGEQDPGGDGREDHVWFLDPWGNRAHVTAGLEAAELGGRVPALWPYETVMSRPLAVPVAP